MNIAVDSRQVLTIKAPRFATAKFRIVGTAPYVQARFSEKARQKLMADMAAGSQAKSRKTREPRDYDADARAAMHISTEGWPGIPAAAFRNAMISACRTVGFKMTLAKLSVFTHADGFDLVDGTPLVRIQGEWERLDMHVRNATGVIDIRCRPMWRNWHADVRIRFDEDQFSSADVANLMMRVGMQVGVGEGRPDSRDSTGLGYGTFDIESQEIL